MFQSFNSPEEALAYVRMVEAEKQARASLQPPLWAAALVPGCYFVRPMVAGPEALLIFGRSQTIEEIEAAERKCGSFGEELEATLASMRSAFKRGYLYGWCYSEIDAGGDLGSTHVADCMPISKALFERAERAGFKPDRDLVKDISAYVAQVATGQIN